ncbi:MAG: hypothetical protein V7607_2261 [Solirubrobacteraceae bacterium]
MSRHHTTVKSLARRLRPTPTDFAAAAALNDPGLLVRAQAAQQKQQRAATSPSAA